MCYAIAGTRTWGLLVICALRCPIPGFAVPYFCVLCDARSQDIKFLLALICVTKIGVYAFAMCVLTLSYAMLIRVATPRTGTTVCYGPKMFCWTGTKRGYAATRC
eukprot:3941979-Rhodomonas_salina.8